MARISTNPLAPCINLQHQPLLPSNPGLIGHSNPPIDSISSTFITASSADYRSSSHHHPCFSSNSCKRKRSRCSAGSPESSSSTEVIALSAESLMAANRAAPAGDQKCEKGCVQRENDHQNLSLSGWHGRGQNGSSNGGMIDQNAAANYRIVSKGEQESACNYGGIITSYATTLTNMMISHDDEDEDEDEDGRNNQNMENEKDCCTGTMNNNYNNYNYPNNNNHDDQLLNNNNNNNNNPNNNNNKRRVYVCPVETCAHHHRSKALGDLTGIRKHFNRKHGERKWKCDRCPKAYAVQSDWKAHLKICGLREFLCDFCNQIFTRKDKFSKHRDYCRALTEEKAKVVITDLDHINAVNPSIMLMPRTNPTTDSTIPHEISSDQSCTSTNSGINSADLDAKRRFDPVNNYSAALSNYNVNPNASMSQSKLKPTHSSVFSNDGSSVYSRDSAGVTNYHNGLQLPGYRSSAGNTSIGKHTLSADDQKDPMYAKFGLNLNSDISRRADRSNTDQQQQQHTELHLNPLVDAAAIMMLNGNNYVSNQLQYNYGRCVGVINEPVGGVINAGARDLNANFSLSIGQRCYEAVQKPRECRSTDVCYGYAHDQISDPATECASRKPFAAAAEGEIGGSSSGGNWNRYNVSYNTTINQNYADDDNGINDAVPVTRDFLSNLS